MIETYLNKGRFAFTDADSVAWNPQRPLRALLDAVLPESIIYHLNFSKVPEA